MISVKRSNDPAQNDIQVKKEKQGMTDKNYFWVGQSIMFETSFGNGVPPTIMKT